jgi:hypothetical protein
MSTIISELTDCSNSRAGQEVGKTFRTTMQTEAAVSFGILVPSANLHGVIYHKIGVFITTALRT